MDISDNCRLNTYVTVDLLLFLDMISIGGGDVGVAHSALIIRLQVRVATPAHFKCSVVSSFGAIY